MEFPASVHPQSPRAMSTPWLRENAASPLEATATNPVQASPSLSQASGGAMPQLQMPRSMTPAESRVARLAAVPARPAVSLNRRAPNSGAAAPPIAQPIAGPELRFPNSIKTVVR
jgi:hypothetical protein